MSNIVNPRYLPGKILPPNIVPAISWEEVFDLLGAAGNSGTGSAGSTGNAEIVINGLPSHALHLFQQNYHRKPLLSLLEQGVPLVSLTKGIDTETLKLSDDILFDLFRPHENLFCFLSGPSYEEEILEQQITLVSLAGKSRSTLIKVSHML
ncbi:MAG: hypothetical protein HQK53_16105, partial [Oligoflexia bacterium]|nr:hypothetical protein [Oligoflexia bacterium]